MKLPSEHDEQVALCGYLDKKKLFYFAIPNGGLRDAITAKRLKMEGVKSGVPDIFLPSLELFIEMKDRSFKKKPSQNQINVMSALTKCGYSCKVAHGAQDAIKIIEGTLKKRGWG